MSTSRPWTAPGEKLRAWMTNNNFTHARLAEILRTSRNNITMMCSGATRPDRWQAYALAGFTGAPRPEDWLSEDEREFARLARNAIVSAQIEESEKGQQPPLKSRLTDR